MNEALEKLLAVLPKDWTVTLSGPMVLQSGIWWTAEANYLFWGYSEDSEYPPCRVEAHDPSDALLGLIPRLATVLGVAA